MKTDLMTRMCALLASVAFAVVATAGVGVMMTKSGDQTWMQARAAGGTMLCLQCFAKGSS